MSDAITSTKLEQTGAYFGTADAVWVHGYLRFEPGAWKWNEGLPCADCKILIPPIVITFSHSILDSTVLSWIWGGGFFKTFLEGSVDHIIYRDYTVNRCFFIYCSLASTPPVWEPHQEKRLQDRNGPTQSCSLHLWLATPLVWRKCSRYWSGQLFNSVGMLLASPCSHHHHHQSLNREDPFFPVLHCPLGLGELQACPFPNVVFLHLPLCALSSSPVPCKTVLARRDERETWPYHCSLRLFTMVRRSSCGPTAFWIPYKIANSLACVKSPDLTLQPCLVRRGHELEYKADTMPNWL